MDHYDDIFSRSTHDRNLFQTSRRCDLVHRARRAAKVQRHDSKRLSRAACCTVV